MHLREIVMALGLGSHERGKVRYHLGKLLERGAIRQYPDTRAYGLVETTDLDLAIVRCFRGRPLKKDEIVRELRSSGFPRSEILATVEKLLGGGSLERMADQEHGESMEHLTPTPRGATDAAICFLCGEPLGSAALLLAVVRRTRPYMTGPEGSVMEIGQVLASSTAVAVHARCSVSLRWRRGIRPEEVGACGHCGLPLTREAVGPGDITWRDVEDVLTVEERGAVLRLRLAAEEGSGLRPEAGTWQVGSEPFRMSTQQLVALALEGPKGKEPREWAYVAKLKVAVIFSMDLSTRHNVDRLSELVQACLGLSTSRDSTARAEAIWREASELRQRRIQLLDRAYEALLGPQGVVHSLQSAEWAAELGEGEDREIYERRTGETVTMGQALGFLRGGRWYHPACMVHVLPGEPSGEEGRDDTSTQRKGGEPWTRTRPTVTTARTS